MKVIIRRKGQNLLHQKSAQNKSVDIEQKLRAEICVWRRERTLNLAQMRQTIWA